MIANSYRKQATTPISEVIELKRAQRPKASGAKRRVTSGEESAVMSWGDRGSRDEAKDIPGEARSGSRPTRILHRHCDLWVGDRAPRCPVSVSSLVVVIIIPRASSRIGPSGKGA
jgi:hypothetical protein